MREKNCLFAEKYGGSSVEKKSQESFLLHGESNTFKFDQIYIRILIIFIMYN
jgi:hypothetical protein